MNPIPNGNPGLEQQLAGKAAEIKEIRPLDQEGNSFLLKLFGNEKSIEKSLQNLNAFNDPYEMDQLFRSSQSNDPILGQFLITPPSSQNLFPLSQSTANNDYGTMNGMQVVQLVDRGGKAPVVESGYSYSWLANNMTDLGMNDLILPSSQEMPAVSAGKQEYYVRWDRDGFPLSQDAPSTSAGATVQSADSQELASDGGPRDFSGQYGFDICFPQKAQGKEWIYKPETKKLFLERVKQWVVQFTMQTCPSSEFSIHALPIFNDKGAFGQNVLPCVKHVEVCQLYKQFLYTEEKGAKHENNRVILTYPGKKTGKSHSVMGRYLCTCNNSCHKAKCNICIVFELHVQGKVEGRKTLNIRSCACPKRDSDIEDRSNGTVVEAVKGRRGRKRKASDADSEDVFIKKEEGLSNGINGNTLTPTKALQTIEKKRHVEREGDRVKISMEVDSPVAYLSLISSHMDILFHTLDGLSRCPLMPGACVPVETITNPGSGFRTTAVAFAKKGPSRENLMEINSWISTVLNMKNLSAKSFFQDGHNIESLDDIFALSRKSLDNLLGEYRDEVVEKVWDCIQRKERPLRPFSGGSQLSIPFSQSQS
ncbi:uncharacterized protein LOC129593864 isoform X2 [Paramacrobiotus metropolitanus]|uniref:uncharacterized protein LOC129593864 isoform X2 n=1 Tax=Paramacrobiotus metropolitanus TaxID=2943436 RepID=UPI002445ED50|nr:uncharacterized protein LOC129593864 isoform X2 [Paramacrobiotus metropolitanus]